MLRRMRRLTQEELASLAGISRNSVSNIERNLNNSGEATDPHLSIVYRLAQALDVPPAVLLPGGDRPVADICSAEEVGITLVWPRSEDDLLPFRRAFVQHGRGPRYEERVELPQVVDPPGRQGAAGPPGRKAIEERGPVTE